MQHFTAAAQNLISRRRLRQPPLGNDKSWCQQDKVQIFAAQDLLGFAESTALVGVKVPAIAQTDRALLISSAPVVRAHAAGVLAMAGEGRRAQEILKKLLVVCANSRVRRTHLLLGQRSSIAFMISSDRRTASAIALRVAGTLFPPSN